MQTTEIKKHEGQTYNVTLLLRSGVKLVGRVEKVDNGLVTIDEGLSNARIVTIIEAGEVAAISYPR
ncbi:MAG: hypothetical protein ABI430_00530 [Candidatus Taylorbacteria bacterium]